MAKLPTSPSYEKEIKQDLKAMMQMTRAPRNLDVFYYFKWCYRKQQSLLNKTTNKTSINSTLRRKRITRLAPSATVLQTKLGLRTKDYDKYFDVFVVWENKYWDSRSGRSRTISGWTDEAVAIFHKWSHIEIPETIERLFYIETREIDTNKTSINSTLSRSFYHRTRNSYRWYHPDQNLTTAQKKEMFRGAFNVDIVSCFTSIWWYDLQGYDCELENAKLLDPARKAELLSIIKRDFNVTDDKRAKQIRTKLTSSKRHWTEKTGVKWYDDLREHIIEKVKKWGEHNLPEGIKLTVHNVFTYLEWQIVERLIEAGRVSLLVHDGLIYSELDKKKLVGKAWPHQVKIECW